MAVSEHSIVDSLSLLSALHVESQERAFLVQPTYCRSRALKQAKRKAFDVLFASLHGPLRSKIPLKPYNSVSENRHDIKVQLLSFVLGLRLQRHFDQADRLEALVDKILPRQDTSQDAESANRLSDICAVLKILLLLKNSVSPADPNSIGYEKRFFPLKKENEGNLPLLPSGPLHYGDSVYSRPYDPFYMHYPRHVFDGISVMHSMNSKMEKLHLPPGENLSGFFSITGVLGDQHENRTQSSLFGALTQSRNITLESKLQLPDLEDSGLFDISIPKLLPGRDFTDSHENTLCQKAAEDSFMDVSCAMFDSGMEDNIWEDALNFEPSKHFTWERRKIGPGVTDQPYMSEAGHQAMDHWYRLRQEKIHMICPSVPVISRDCISEESFVQDLINVSLGIPSSSFIFLKDLVTFELSDDIYLSGVTPEVLRSISEPFQLCGASYLRLAKFSRPQVEDSFYTKGLVFQAFLSCIRRILQHFCAIVLSIPEDITLFKLLTSSRKFMDQLNYLAALCKCESGTGLDNIDIFPTGVHLLSYIYQECLEGMGSDNYPMLLSILQGACGPYTVFVQDWIFYGTCRDRYGEFMIEVHDDYLQFKDKYYWTRGYTFTTNEVTESVPLFLSELAQEIFTCGKSVNLLKACNSQHFLCKLNDLEVPRIRVTFSEHDLVDMGTQCDFYVGKMQAIANNLVVARKNKEALEKRARQDLLQRAKQAAIEDIHRLQERVQEMRRLEDAKKRQELQFLKDQMDGDKERRTAEKQAQRQEDKDFIARVTRQEEALSEAEKELEKRAREELVEYYERLTEEAALREQRALWHVRRGKLQEKRQKFLTQDEMYWLEQYKNTEKPVVMDDDMPSWVKRYDGPAPVVVPDTSDTLPDWAQKVVGPDKGEPFVDADLKGNTTNQQDQVAVTSDLEPSQHQTLPPVTTGIRMSQTQSSTAESSEQPQKASIHVFTDRHATTESKASERVFQPHIRSVENMSATKESDQSGTLQVKAHIKISDKMSATKQSEAERDNIPRLRGHASHHATLQSTEEKELNVPRLKRNVQQHSSTESQSAEWKIKKASVYGHASMESTAEVQIPRLKPRPQSLQDVSDREFKDFGIRPRIKINKDRHATQETESQEVRSWSGIRMGPISANQESQPVDTEELMRERFKARNVHGHASDSTVEKLLYGNKGQEEAQGDEEFEKVTITFLDTPLMEKFRYQDKFDFFGDQPKVDLMSKFTVYGSFGDHGNSLSPDVESFQYLPLSELLRQSITRPIAAQISLVNESIINYFMLELNIKEHFEALRKYLFMGDGDFAQNLSDILLEKLASNPAPHELLNPIFLNGTLSKAIKSSMHPDDKYAENLNFALKYFPKYLNTAAHDTLDCLQLKYKVDWPMNIIVTEESVAKYCKVFSFMLQLKRIVWVLKDVWHQLKRDALVYKSGGSCQFRQLQLFRQEMQHFVKVMQGYIANQVVLVTWQEFEEALQNTIHNLDDLHDRHSSYLDKAIFRCLLNTKAAPVMKIIQDIFRLITKFHSQLIHGAWNPAGTLGACHTNFSQMEASYKTFRQYSVFLFKVVNKLSVRGYQPHLQELLLRLNFNDYYKP